VQLVTDKMGRVYKELAIPCGFIYMRRVMSCNSALHDIIHVLVNNLIRAFPSEGRTAATSNLKLSSRVLHMIVLPVPPGTYSMHN
jgi:hypothetical protein